MTLPFSYAWHRFDDSAKELSEYVRLAAGAVLVTDRDRAVAGIVPPHAGVSIHVSDAVLADMVRHGLISPAFDVTPEPPPRQPGAPTATILTELRADRGA